MIAPRCARRCRGDAGQFAGIEAIPFSILVFVTGSLIVTSAWAVIDAKMMTTSAAREAARSYVESDPSLSDGAAVDLADAVADSVAQNYGRSPERLVTRWGPTDPPPRERCQRIAVTTTYQLPALTVPFLGGLGPGYTVTSTHSELVDPYRDGLPAGGVC